MVSLLSGDVSRFCMAYKVRLTPPWRWLQREVRDDLTAMMAGRGDHRLRAPVDNPLRKELDGADQYASGAALSTSARTRYLRGFVERLVKREFDLLIPEVTAELRVISPRALRVYARVIVALTQVKEERPSIRRCATCREGFAFVVGKRRPKDCEACRARLSPKQRWSRRQGWTPKRRRRLRVRLSQP